MVTFYKLKAGHYLGPGLRQRDRRNLRSRPSLLSVHEAIPRLREVLRKLDSASAVWRLCNASQPIWVNTGDYDAGARPKQRPVGPFRPIFALLQLGRPFSVTPSLRRPRAVRAPLRSARRVPRRQSESQLFQSRETTHLPAEQPRAPRMGPGGGERFDHRQQLRPRLLVARQAWAGRQVNRDDPLPVVDGRSALLHQILRDAKTNKRLRPYRKYGLISRKSAEARRGSACGFDGLGERTPRRSGDSQSIHNFVPLDDRTNKELESFRCCCSALSASSFQPGVP